MTPGSNNSLNPEVTSEQALRKLLSNAEFTYIIQSLDCILLDEMGQNSSQFLAAIDLICQKIRNRSDLFGGILVIATIDEFQLHPITGVPCLISPVIIMAYRLIKLNESIRAEEPEMKRICQIARMPAADLKANPALLNRLEELLSSHATWVDNWEDVRIPEETIRVFARRKVALAEVSRCLNNLRQKFEMSHQPHIVAKCEDEISGTESHSGWQPSNSKTSSLLSQRIHEPELLLLFEGGVYEATRNLQNQGISYGQMLILTEVPDRSTVRNGDSITFLCAPNGLKQIPVLKDAAVLKNQGWTEKKISSSPTQPKFLGHGQKMKGRRKQYPIKHKIATTIHAIMGTTGKKELGLGCIYYYYVT